MTQAFSYACRDCEGMETCPASMIAESKEELWQLIGRHAQIAHGEDPEKWDTVTKTYLDTLIRPVTVSPVG